MATIEQGVAGYIKLRKLKQEMQERHKEELAPINKKMNTIETWLLGQLQKENADNIKTPSGTVYQSTLVKPKINDWSSLLDHIKQHELWGMLEHRVSKAAVEEYMESTGDAPPGVEITRETFARIRK